MTQLRVPSRSDDRLDYDGYVQLVEKVNRLTEWFFSPQDFHVSGSAVMLASGTSGALNITVFCFGYTLSGVTLTVKAGEVHFGALPAALIADTNISLAAVGTHYIYVEYVPGGAATLHDQVGRPQSDETTYRIWLYKWTSDGSNPVLAQIGHIGNIELPGDYGGV